MKKLTKLAIENLLIFQTFILGQKNMAPKIASNFGNKFNILWRAETEDGNPISLTNEAT